MAKHRHVVNTNVPSLSFEILDPIADPGARLIYTHDEEDTGPSHFLILGVDGNLKVENEVAKLLAAHGAEIVEL